MDLSSHMCTWKKKEFKTYIPISKKKYKKYKIQNKNSRLYCLIICLLLVIFNQIGWKIMSGFEFNMYIEVRT